LKIRQVGGQVSTMGTPGMIKQPLISGFLI